MPEKIEELVRAALAAAQEAGDLPAFELEDCGIERPADTSHGEWTSTMALKSAKLAHQAPRAIAEAIVKYLPESDVVEKVEIAGPGFINFYLSVAAKNAVFAEAREQGMDFAKSNVGGGLKTQVEFVSANPVGPMHVGHGRWAALGDSMCRVMEHAGYDIEREFWINDYGNQMNTFGNSISKRYMQLADIIEKQGCDIDAARDFLAKDRDNYVQDEADEHPDSHPYMDDFTADLGTCHDVRCDFDVWMSERTMYQKDWTGTSPVERAYDKLDKMGYLYRTDDGALWFKSTEFGDDKDRVIQKSNGDYTYFSSDIAYHWNKFQRVDRVLDIWGADHHGYIARVKAVCDALGYPGQFEVPLGQFVNLLRNGKPIRMSKRKGTMITFRELIDEVGADAARYTLVSRSSNQTIDFDIEKVKEKTADNPVFYVQYAHARICSILRKAAGVTPEQADLMGMENVAIKAIYGDVDYSLLTDPTELALSRKLSELQDLIAGAARDRAPFRITHYVEELASAFHSFYAACQVLPSEGRPVDPAVVRARLGACDAVRSVIALCLSLIGVSAPTQM